MQNKYWYDASLKCNLNLINKKNNHVIMQHNKSKMSAKSKPDLLRKTAVKSLQYLRGKTFRGMMVHICISVV